MRKTLLTIVALGMFFVSSVSASTIYIFGGSAYFDASAPAARYVATGTNFPIIGTRYSGSADSDAWFWVPYPSDASNSWNVEVTFFVLETDTVGSVCFDAALTSFDDASDANMLTTGVDTSYAQFSASGSSTTNGLQKASGSITPAINSGGSVSDCGATNCRDKYQIFYLRRDTDTTSPCNVGNDPDDAVVTMLKFTN